MTVLRDLLASESFSSSISAASNGPSIVVVHRGAGGLRHASGAAALDGAAVESVQAALDMISDALGMDMANASVFCSPSRTNATVKFAIAGSDSVLALYHDVATSRADLQILHAESKSIALGSLSDLMLAHADPWIMLEHHVGAASAGLRSILEDAGLEPEIGSETELEYDAHVLALRWR
jgi:hypothetical protein